VTLPPAETNVSLSECQETKKRNFGFILFGDAIPFARRSFSGYSIPTISFGALDGDLRGGEHVLGRRARNLPAL
jgi:hypothetical protein